MRAYATTPLGQLHYDDSGAGSTGHSILCLHQTPRSLDEFAEVLPLLAADGSYRVIAMDMLGFGLSAKLPPSQTIDDYAKGVVALLDALNIQSVCLMGHHTGAAVAIEVAAAHPNRVSKLILSGCNMMDAEYRRKHQAHPVAVDNAPVQDDGSHLVELWKQRRPFYPAGRPDLLQRFIRDALFVDPVVGHTACAHWEGEVRLRLVTAPTLIIVALRDPFTSTKWQSIKAALGSEQVQVVEIDGGIPLMEEKPREVADAVLEWL